MENPQCQIEIVNYYAYVDGTDNRAAQMKLAADIASGEIPDIYDFSLNSIDTAPSIGQYARRGMLENIYSYLDNDAQLSRSDFFEGYLKSLELNGGLYEVVPEYSLETTFANSRVVGTQDKWTYAVVANHITEVSLYEVPAGTKVISGSGLSALMRPEQINTELSSSATAPLIMPSALQENNF